MKTFKTKRKIGGFNLIELMVSLAIMSFLMTIAMPSFTAWMASSRARNVSDSISYGLIQARSEAIRRNDYVTFTLGSDTSWTIANSSGSVINKKSASESSRNTVITFNPSSATTVTFNGIGGVSANFDTTSTLTDITVASSESGDGIRSFTLKVGFGGAFAMCSYPQNTAPTC